MPTHDGICAIEDYIERQLQAEDVSIYFENRKNRQFILADRVSNGDFGCYIHEHYIPEKLEWLLSLWVVADKNDERKIISIMSLPFVQNWIYEWNIVAVLAYCEAIYRHFGASSPVAKTVGKLYSEAANIFISSNLYDGEEYIYCESIIEERRDIFERHLSALQQQSRFKSLDDAAKYIAKEIKKKYEKLPALEDGFGNLFEYWALLDYERDNHIMYNIAEADLQREIYHALKELKLCDLLLMYMGGRKHFLSTLPDICGIYFNQELDFDRIYATLGDLENMEYFELLHEVQSAFYRILPTYES